MYEDFHNLRAPIINEGMMDKILRGNFNCNDKKNVTMANFEDKQHRAVVNDKIMSTKMNAEILEEMIKIKMDKKIKYDRFIKRNKTCYHSMNKDTSKKLENDE